MQGRFLIITVPISKLEIETEPNKVLCVKTSQTSKWEKKEFRDGTGKLDKSFEKVSTYKLNTDQNKLWVNQSSLK